CVKGIFETVVNTLTHDSDDNFNDISDDTVYFKEEERMNELSEEVSKKSEVVVKAPEAQAKPLVSNEDNDDVYFDEVNDIVSSEPINMNNGNSIQLHHLVHPIHLLKKIGTVLSEFLT
ncbi:3764_t:CDS:2, partial [Funneliformis geosporum]